MKLTSRIKIIGPGIVVAATGLGAGDIVAASVAGAQYGTALLWAVLVGGILKFCLNEGLARWQLVSGKTLLEGWIDHLPRLFTWYFMAYIVLWSVMVAAALIAATGLAAYAVFPQLSLAFWGGLHSLLALLIVGIGGYGKLELLMKIFVGLMFFSIVACGIKVLPSLPELAQGLLIPRVPDHSVAYVLGVIGGVGGSVTIMSYGYWMREAGWQREEHIPASRLDLAVAYGLTTLFGIAIVLVSAGVDAEIMSGNQMALAVAGRLEILLGPWGKWVFLLGFWGAVFSSMIGVWHGVPYLAADFYYYAVKGREARDALPAISRSGAYRLYLLFLAIFPISLLLSGRPVWVVMAYAVTGAFFMPVLAALLLYMNNQVKWLGRQRSGWTSNVVLGVALLLFSALLFIELQSRFN